VAITAVHLLAPVAFGGGEAALCQLFEASPPDLHNHVLTVGVSTAFEERAATAGVPVHRVSGGQQGQHRSKASALADGIAASAVLPRVRRLLRSLDADVVHAHGFPPSALASMVLGRRGGPAGVYTHHYDRHPPGRAERRALRSVFGRFDVRTAVSEAVAARMSGFFSPLQFVHVPNPVAPSFFAVDQPPSFEGTVRAVVVGRLVPDKGHILLFEALARLPVAARDRLEVGIVGDGPLLGALREQVTQLGLGTIVTFRGASTHDAIPDVLAGADVVVVPSLREGFGLAAAEAMATGRLVVAHDLPAIRELTRGAALLTPVGGLHEGLSTVLEDPLRSAALAAAARSAVEHLRPHAVTDRYLTLYRRVTPDR
jgi:glycosyltransferase involved in cell wall biosynthesis